MNHSLVASLALLLAAPSSATTTPVAGDDAALVEQVGKPIREKLLDEMTAWRSVLFVSDSPSDAVWGRFGARYAALQARVAGELHPGALARSRYEFQSLLDDALHDRHKAAKRARQTDAGFGDYKAAMTATADKTAVQLASGRAASARAQSVAAQVLSEIPVLPTRNIDFSMLTPAPVVTLLPSRSLPMTGRLAPVAVPSLMPVLDASPAVQLYLSEARDASLYDAARRFLLQRGAQAQVVDATIHQALKKGVDPIVPLAVCMQESGCAATTLDKQGRVVPMKSGAGAIGAFQIMPDMHGATSAELTDTSVNVSKGIGLLIALDKKFDDFELILAGYNAGEGAVQKAGGVPNYAETKGFVKKVADNVETLRKYVWSGFDSK